MVWIEGLTKIFLFLMYIFSGVVTFVFVAAILYATIGRLLIYLYNKSIGKLINKQINFWWFE